MTAATTTATAAGGASFEAFATGPLDGYLAAARRTGSVFVFHHIPKTAGSSLTRELAGGLAPYRNVFVRSGPRLDENRADLMMAAVETFLEEHRTRHYRSASGHFRAPHVARIAGAIPTAKVFTILRDPAERVVSDYRYARTPKHPPHEEFARRFPTIESYLDAPGQQNKMWRMLGGDRPFDEAALGEVFRRYLFFGLVAELETDFAFLAALESFPRRPAARVNVTERRADNEVALTPELRSRIETVNGSDCALYAAVEGILARRRAEMREVIAARRAWFLGGDAGPGGS